MLDRLGTSPWLGSQPKAPLSTTLAGIAIAVYTCTVKVNIFWDQYKVS